MYCDYNANTPVCGVAVLQGDIFAPCWSIVRRCSPWETINTLLKQNAVRFDPDLRPSKCKCWTEGVMLLNTQLSSQVILLCLCVNGSALRFLLSDTETERVSKAIQYCWYTICTRYRIIMTECLGYQNIFTLLRNRDYCKLLLICRSITPCMYIHASRISTPVHFETESNWRGKAIINFLLLLTRTFT